MKRKVIHSPNAPAAVGPYSQAIQTGNLLFISGQIGLDPQSGKLAEGLEAQTRQVLSNISAVLDEANSGADKIVKTTIFLTDISDFATVNAIYEEMFQDEPPARSTIQVAALPLGSLVEIETIALTSETGAGE